ncbi:MAG: family 1 glycosylhydrolase [Candidatus Moranbacteria bacterium]|nr:family 1 glycosylhydrolase [Candidatus Moranbacteria bacterium]
MEKNHELLSELGVNSFRMSIEWSRIEPEERFFDASVLERCQDIFDDLHARDIEIVLTLFHWTMPVWFGKKTACITKKHQRSFVDLQKKLSMSITKTFRCALL